MMTLIPNTAYMITPVVITDSMLSSCTVTEPSIGETSWVSGSSYSIGDEVIRTTTHKKYKCLIAGVSSSTPETTPSVWLDIGYTNRWKQFDKKVGTKTSVSSGSLTTVLSGLGSVEGLALIDLVGTSVIISVKETPGGSVVYSKTITLDGTIVTDVYDWMYAEYSQKLNVVLVDLPGQYPSCEITVTVNSTSGAAIGSLVVGTVKGIGATTYGAGAGILNWGKVQEDGFGNREWVEGEWANRVTLPIVANNNDLNRLHRQLAKVRSTPCIYIGTTLDNFEPLICYGVYRELYITIPNYNSIQLNLEIDGLNNI